MSCCCFVLVFTWTISNMCEHAAHRQHPDVCCMCKQAHWRHYPELIFFLTLSRVQAVETNWNNAHFQTNLTDSDRPRGSPEKAHLVPSISSPYQPLSLLRLQPLRLGADLDYSKPTTPSLPPLPPPLVQRPLSAQHSQIRKCPNGRSYVLL